MVFTGLWPAHALAGSDSAVASTGLPDPKLLPAHGASPHSTAVPHRPLHRLPAHPTQRPEPTTGPHSHAARPWAWKSHGRSCAGHVQGPATSSFHGRAVLLRGKCQKRPERK